MDSRLLADMHPLMAQEEVKKSVAIITHIGYNPKCSTTENLPGGAGTRHMIRTAMTLVLIHYDWIKRFRIVDNSEVFCKEALFVSLAHMSLATNGKTYYEKYLHATLENDDARRAYEVGVTRLTDASQKLPFAQFVSLFRVAPAIEAKLFGSYEETGTYSEFFNAFTIKPT